jgi:hypothetical protein
MTAAHCVGTPEGTTETNRRLTSGTMVFGYFEDTAPKLGYRTLSIPYSSLNRADVAIVKLEVSLKFLIGRDITPFPFASQRPANGTKTVVVGAPLFTGQKIVIGTPTAESLQSDQLANPMRAAACDNYLSTYQMVYGKAFDLKNEYTNQCRGVETGSSGGPVLTVDGRVAAVTSASTHAPDERGELTIWIGNIAQPVDHLKDCFSEGEFNVANPGCKPDLFDSTFKQLGEHVAARNRDVAARNRERNNKPPADQTS